MFIAIRVDASPQFGAGHAIRCLTLADELRSRGGEIVFVAAAMIDTVRHRIIEAGHRLEIVPHSDSGVEKMGREWDRSTMPPDQQQADAALTLQALCDRSIDWMIVDHYRLGEPWERAVRSSAKRILVIDDLANRSHYCEVLVDQTPGRANRDYQALVPRSCTVLTGSSYTLLKPEFVKLRPAALARRAVNRRLDRVLISLGLTDPAGLTSLAARSALEVLPGLAIDLLVGSSAETLPDLISLSKENRRVALHIDSKHVASLMGAADLAIGAGGTSSWERCCLGLPSITVVLAENQVFIAQQLERHGAATTVHPVSKEALTGRLQQLADDERWRSEMAGKAAALIDGSGVERTAGVIFEG